MQGNHFSQNGSAVVALISCNPTHLHVLVALVEKIYALHTVLGRRRRCLLSDTCDTREKRSTSTDGQKPSGRQAGGEIKQQVSSAKILKPTHNLGRQGRLIKHNESAVVTVFVDKQTTTYTMQWRIRVHGSNGLAAR